MINSPLEQFRVIEVMGMDLGVIDISVTNSSVYCLLTVGSLKLVWSIMLINGGLLVPSRYQVGLEMVYKFVLSLTKEQLGGCNSAGLYLGIVLTTFMYILGSNLIGLIPFSFATTAQLVIAFSLSVSLFIGVTLIGIKRHGLHFVSFFLPVGAPIGLAPLLVMIEVISYIFRPISLGVRLFANMTAGHSLLAIIAGFGWSIGTSGSVMSLLGSIPVVVIVVILGLELAVAFLQAYVFTVLLCIYLKDAIELH